MSKKITIQIWTDLYYCRCIAKYWPEAPIVPAPTSPLDIIPKFNDAPFLICLSSMYSPRNEVMGNAPVAPGQHPIPKDFLETQIRHVSYLFANEFGIFQPESKAMANTFIAKQTVGYTMIKELEQDVSPATGSMSLKELRDSIDQYTDEEQKKIQVVTVGEHPNDADKKNIDQYIHFEKTSKIRQYISVTKLVPVYVTQDPYVNNSQLPTTPTDSLPTGSEFHPVSQAITSSTTDAIAADNTNREALATFDTLSASNTPMPVLDAKGEPIVDAAGTPVTEVPTVDRIKVLEEMLAKKNKQLEDAGLIPPTVPIQM